MKFVWPGKSEGSPLKLSTRGRYAVMAMSDLALNERDGYVRLSDIAERQHLSRAYLEQLFVQLRAQGLVYAHRGPKGGYRLGRDAGAITVSEIILAVDEPIKATRCADRDGAPGCQFKGTRCVTHHLWSRLGKHIHAFLQGVTLADIVADATSQPAFLGAVE
jgi:Rrf2 family transcriptional regulator, iron-sulfur cluster assembly transcription factor